MAYQATIYVIEIDDPVRDSLRVLLECTGFQVLDTASCTVFLNDARADETDCILVSDEMPDMEGMELLHRLREEGNPIGAIVMSGRHDPGLALAVNRVGAALLEKPFAATELIRLITEMLHINRQQKLHEQNP